MPGLEPQARHEALFQPPLPPAKVEAIGRLRIGIVDKIVVDFEEGGSRGGEGGVHADAPEGLGALAPSDKGVVSYALLWDEEEASQGGSGARLPAWARGIFSVRFGGPEFKRRRRPMPGVGERCSDSSSSDPGSSSEEEEEDAADESAKADAQRGQPTAQQAVIWVTGAEAAELEVASDAEVLAGLRSVAALFPGLALPEGAAWEAARLHRSAWGADPHFRGSFSYLGCEASLADVDTLCAPLEAAGRPVVLFAGEACHAKYIVSEPGAAACFWRST